MSDERKHTPVPWTAAEYSPILWEIFGEKEMHVLFIDNNRQGLANAEFICRAVNTHDELLRACKELREVSAVCLRIFHKANWQQLENGGIDELEKELKSLGIEKGFGVRAQQAIALAEKP
jgi:hypothetical protein